LKQEVAARIEHFSSIQGKQSFMTQSRDTRTAGRMPGEMIQYPLMNCTGPIPAIPGSR
jgi:hypothetical protein